MNEKGQTLVADLIAEAHRGPEGGLYRALGNALEASEAERVALRAQLTSVQATNAALARELETASRALAGPGKPRPLAEVVPLLLERAQTRVVS